MRAVAAVMAAAMLLLLTGCGAYAPEFLPQPTPRRDDLVDTWVHEYDGEEPYSTRILVGNQLPFDDIILSYVVGGPDSGERYRFYH